MRIPDYIRQYLEEDTDELIACLKSHLDDVDIAVISSNVDSNVDASGNMFYDVVVSLDMDGYLCSADWTYLEEGNDVLTDVTIEDLCESIIDHYHDASELNSKPTVYGSRASSRKQAPIMAAEDDEAFSDFDEYATDEPAAAVSDTGGDIDNTLEGIANDIQDMQDSLENIQEDDVDIEIENNITGHLIAECDNCHGVFISAVILSDQIADSIHGICPLCEKESDQYLKWSIHDVKDEEVYNQ